MFKIERERGTFRVFINGIHTCQAFNIDKALDELNGYLEKENIEISTIIEIGTGLGGFTTLLANHQISNKAKIHTFDIENKRSDKFIALDKVVCYIENAFTTKTIPILIKNKENCLVFCDGGLKVKEFRTFAPLLKSNDFIFCHDYIKDCETFHLQYRKKLWASHEVDFVGIEKTVKENNLDNILAEVFEKVVWASYRKR